MYYTWCTKKRTVLSYIIINNVHSLAYNYNIYENNILSTTIFVCYKIHRFLTVGVGVLKA